VQNISVSILDAKDKKAFLEILVKENEKIKKISDKIFEIIVHFDVMDNKFVPNTGVDLECIKIAKELGMYADVHLMVEKPFEDGYIDKAFALGADRISIHYEIENFEKQLNYLNTLDVKVGVVVKPNTDVSVLEKYKDKFSNLLIMTVEPGYGGQKYIKEMNKKIQKARNI